MRHSVLDLFAGCGGLSLGLSNAGYDVIAACERDAWAADTLEANHPETQLIRSDIRDLSDQFWRSNFAGAVDIVAGGPPCQGFSISGKRQYGILSEQNTLVEEFLRVALLLRPKAILIENVQGFRTALLKPGVKALDFVTKSLTQSGYHVHTKVLQATEYGVPSLRARFFLIASLDPFEWDPFPAPTHEQPGLPAAENVLDAIDDLPVIAAREGVDGPQPYTQPARSEFQKRMRLGSTAVYNHVAMNHTPRLVERFQAIAPGGSSYRIGRKDDEETTVTVYKSNNQRLVGTRPSLCITANFQSNYVHPFSHRNLTAREAARLMTFPDTYIFKGKRTQMSSGFLKKYNREHENHLSQYNQIGNAVPPLLAEKIGRSLLAALAGKRDDGPAHQLELKWTAA